MAVSLNQKPVEKVILSALSPGDKVLVKDVVRNLELVMGSWVIINHFKSVLIYLNRNSLQRLNFTDVWSELKLGKEFYTYSRPDHRAEYQEPLFMMVEEITIIPATSQIHPDLLAPKLGYIEYFHPGPNDKIYVHFFNERNEYKVRILEFGNPISDDLIAVTETYQYVNKIGKLNTFFDLDSCISLGKPILLFDHQNRSKKHLINCVCGIQFTR